MKQFNDRDHSIKNRKMLKWGYGALLSALESYEHQSYYPLNSDEHRNKGRYDYQPYSINWFLHHLHDAHQVLKYLRPDEKKKFKFVDIGCGVGTKVKLANALFDAHGIEVWEPYTEVAKELMKKKIVRNHGKIYELKDTNRILVEDATKFENYGNYDILYFFRPLSEPEKEIKLENRIYQQAKPGTIVIPLWHDGDLPEYIRPLSCPSGEIHIKMHSKKKFDALNEWVKENLT